MSIDVPLSVAGALVGLLVGLTGMGGGALLTPILVLVFGVPPLAAVSSDLVTSMIMKPVAAAVHWRRNTVEPVLVGWLALGSIPAAVLGAGLVGWFGHAKPVQHDLKIAIGCVLLLSLAANLTRAGLDAGARPAGEPFAVRPARTVAIGVVGGFAVGLTSVGAGSVIIALLLLAYPMLSPRQLVGTDIVQAIPLVAAAALSHLLFGEVRLSVTGSLLVGALPAAYLGARLSIRLRTAWLQPVIVAVLLASALALLSVPTPTLLVAVGLTAGASAAVSNRRAAQERIPART